jgi:hypothetical protein
MGGVDAAGGLRGQHRRLHDANQAVLVTSYVVLTAGMVRVAALLPSTQ